MVGVERARLVGREQELQQVHAAVGKARAGEVTMQLIEGEAGIGKSRLVAEARAAFVEPSDVVITSQAVELSGGDLPYGVVAAALRDFARQDLAGLGQSIDPEARTTLRELSRALTGGATEPLDRGHVLDSFVSAVESLSQSRLLWWIVEDLHWADASSRDVLAYLIRTVAPCHLLVSATLRTDTPRSVHITDFVAGLTRASRVSRLSVPRLTADQVASLSQQLSSEQLSASLVQRVVRLGEGVPLWTEELVLGGLQTAGPLPDSVSEMLDARVMRLQPQARLVIEAVSLTDNAWHEDLAAVCSLDPDELESACSEAVGASVLVVDTDRPAYRFRHALLREAVAAELLPGTRMRLHRRWAEVLHATSTRTGDGSGEFEAAHHWAEAGQPTMALEATVAAAALADQVAAKQEQGVLWSRALDLWSSVPDAAVRSGLTRAEVALRCITALFAAGEYDDCLQRLNSELAHRDDDVVRLLYLRLRRVVVLEELAIENDDTDVLDRLPSTALMLLNTDQANTWLAAALVMCAYYLSDDDVRLAMQLSERAIEVARAHADLPMEMHGVDAMSWNLGNLGRFEPAIQLLGDGVLRARHGAPSWASMLEGSMSWYMWGLGDYDGSIAASRSALQYIQRPSAAAERVAWLTESLVESLLAVGRWDEASQRLDELIALTLTGQAAVALHCLAGILSIRRGDPSAAAQHYHRAQQHTPPQEDSLLSQRVPPHWLAAELAAADNDLGGVRFALAPLWDAPHPEVVSETLWRPILLAARVEADRARLPSSARSSDGELVEDMWDRLFDVSASLHDLGPVTAAWRDQLEAEQQRAQGKDTAARWDSIASAWRALGQPYESAAAMVRQAECTIREGDRSAGSELLTQVISTAELLSARPLLADAAALSRRARLQVAPATDQDLVIDGVRRPALTARELEVLTLLARGHDNAQVASALFISAKTASVHVSHILAKLGVSSRTQAVSLALRRGLVSDDLSP